MNNAAYFGVKHSLSNAFMTYVTLSQKISQIETENINFLKMDFSFFFLKAMDEKYQNEIAAVI